MHACQTWLVTLSILALSSIPLSACLWTSGTSKDAKHISVAGYSPAKQLRNSLKTDLLERAAQITGQMKGDDLASQNDVAVALIYQGDYETAVDRLEKQERETPGEYITAANLGTALELSGRNEEALKWINEGMRRNPDSHGGTEWLHAKILEAKIQAEKDPDYFKRHSVLDLDHSQIDRDKSILTVAGQQLGVHDVGEALRYQLKERLQFVKTTDAPVASLLFDYAAIAAETHSLEAAKELLQMAAEFGYPQDKVQPLQKKYDRLIFFADVRKWIGYLVIAAVVTWFIIYALKRKWIVYRR